MNFKKCFNCLNWNLILAVLYLAQGVLIYLLMDVTLSRPLDVTFLSRNVLDGQLQTTVKTIYDLDFRPVLLIVPSIAGLFHLVFGLKTRVYQGVLQRRINIWRWLIGGIISGLILSLTALILGVADLAYLLLLFASMLGFGWLGLITEYIKACVELTKSKSVKIQRKDKALRQLLNLVFSFKEVSGLLPWLLVGISFASGGLLATGTYGWQHSLIYLSGLLLVVVWLINSATDHTKTKKRRNYSAVESVYIFSSFVFTSAWIWLVASLGA